jgi:hypothetical protein
VRTLCLIAAIAIVSCGGGTPRHNPPPPPSFQLRDFRLKSGMRIIGEEDHSSPLVGVVNIVGAGSANDPPGKEGLAHLVECTQSGVLSIVGDETIARQAIAEAWLSKAGGRTTASRE